MRIGLTIVCLLLAMAGRVSAADHFNVLVYHHVADDTPPSTTISPERFRTHMELLRDEGFTVVPITQALASVRGETDEPLPEKAVVLTFDDAFANIYENGFPIMKEFDYPFTVFAATDPIDQNFEEMMSWDQLRELQDWGVTVTNHSSDHDYMVRHAPRDEAWLERMRANVQNAQQRLEEELDAEVPKLFAYPYGEYSSELKSMLDEEGYIAFAQHSGGVYSGSDFLALPRFAAAGVYANPDTLLTKLNSHPMPVDYDTVPDMPTEENPPAMTIEVTDTSDISRSWNCFVNGDRREGEWRDDDRFYLRAAEPLGEGRHRYNCTAQARSGGFFYWYSQPWLIWNP